MRILIVGLNFHPEFTGIGKYTGEMAAFLRAAGHKVRVVTAPPYYPYWKVQPGYRWWAYRRESWSGVEVYRCPLWVPRHPSGVKRIPHLLSFALSSLPVVLAQVLWGPQIVLCIAPSLFSAPFALLAARLCGARAWLHVQDFELDAAAQLGLIGSDRFLAKWAARGERWLLRAFERVSTISERMLARLEGKGVRPQRASLFPNWVDTQAVFPLPYGPKSLRKEFGLPADKVIVLYAGNMGVKQGLEILVEAAGGLRKNSAIHFVLCGEGSARAGLERATREMRNVQFLPLQPPEKLNRLLNVADIHILPQRADAADLVMPSKLLGMLASGKAVVATAKPGTGIGTVVSQVGMLVPPGDLPALCETLQELAQLPDLRTRLGQKGRAFVCKHWSAEHVLAGFELRLRDFVQARSKQYELE
ncbi:MAG: colanic acid biosynthesis glycosyltransferase WcaI [Chloroflexi bacterium]|nr:MAG: colanic acid biosynthesis glycosyltransferase WcaI [Chloroflexota bacterium]